MNATTPLDLLGISLPGETVAALMAVAGAVAVFLLIWRALLQDDPLAARLKALEQRRTDLRGALASRVRRQRRMVATETGWEGLKRRLRKAQGAGTARVQLKLARAGYRSRDALLNFRLARVLAPVAITAAVAACVYGLGLWDLGPHRPTAVAAALLFGLFAPEIYVINQAQKRREAIQKTLPDGFDLLVICAEAGLSLDAALERVSREIARSAPELSDELAVTSLELSFLPDRNKALSGLADRIPIGSVRALVNTFMQTERYGTPLVQALRVLSAELREERMLKAEEKAARLPAVLTVPMIIFILPPLFVVLLGPAILRTIDGLGGVTP